MDDGPAGTRRAVRLETPRLVLRELRAGDAAFILTLLNDPDWLRYIGDKQVRTLADAAGYITQGPAAMLARHGHGLLCVERRDDGVAIGLCGLLRREGLDDPDLGFAFLPAGRGQGLAREAAAAVLADGRARLGLGRIVAITTPANESSMRLLRRLGFLEIGSVRLQPEAEALRLFVLDDKSDAP